MAKKRVIRGAAVVFAILSFLVVRLVATDLYVSANGASATHCTKLKPCALTAVRPFAKAAVAANKGPVKVHVGAGAYFLTASLAFDASDSGTATSPVTYQGEGAVLDGGRPVTNFVNVPSRNFWRATIADGTTPRQLWLNDRRAARARTPNGVICGNNTRSSLRPSRMLSTLTIRNPTGTARRGLAVPILSPRLSRCAHWAMRRMSNS